MLYRNKEKKKKRSQNKFEGEKFILPVLAHRFHSKGRARHGAARTTLIEGNIFFYFLFFRVGHATAGREGKKTTATERDWAGTR